MTEALHIVATKEQLRELFLELLDDHVVEPVEQVDAVGAAEMCRRLSISRSTLHRMRHAGCPALKVGANEFRYEPRAVLAWLRARSEP